MKDSLFEMLLNLFEKTLTQLKEKHQSQNANENGHDEQTVSAVTAATDKKMGVQLEFIKSADLQSTRVFTLDEQIKLTKASYQFLMRMLSFGILASDTFEIVINRLIFSESRFVALQETKWTIRNTLSDRLDAEQLAFLDMVLYQQEDGLALH